MMVASLHARHARDTASSPGRAEAGRMARGGLPAVALGLLAISGAIAPAPAVGAAPATPPADVAERAASIDSLLAQGHYAAAETAARGLLADIPRDPPSLDRADALSRLARAMIAGGRPSEAISIARRAVLLMSAILDARDDGSAEANAIRLSRARSKILLGVAHAASGEEGAHATALGVYESAREDVETAAGTTHPEYVHILFRVADIYRIQSKIPQARESLERARAILEATAQPNALLMSDCLFRLGALHHQAGEFREAAELYERVLDLQARRLPDRHPKRAQTLLNLSIMLRALGEYGRARDHCERALEIYRSELGPEHDVVGYSLGVLAKWLTEQGDYAGALGKYDEAVAILERRGAPEKLAVALDSRGSLRREMGQYEEARDDFQQALRYRRRVHPGAHPDIALSYRNLGVVSSDLADYATARNRFRSALDMYRRTQPDGPSIAWTLLQMAVLEVLTGNRDAAGPLIEEAVSKMQRAYEPGHPHVAWSLYYYAGYLAGGGRLEAARSLYSRVQTIFEDQLGGDHPRVAMALTGVAECLAGSEPERALAAALRAEEIASRHLEQTVRVLPDRRALQYASIRTSAIDLALSIAVDRFRDDPDTVRRVWDRVVGSRARVLDEMAARHRPLVDTDDPELARLAQELVEARRRLAHLIVRGPADLAWETYRGIVDQAEADKERLEIALESKRLPSRAPPPRRPGWRDAMRRLPAGDCLVAFFLYRRTSPGARLPPGPSRPTSAEPGAALLGTPAGVPSYLVFVRRAGEEAPILIDLGPAERINDLVFDWRREFREGKLRDRTPWRDKEADYRQVAARLRAAIWDPVAPYAQGAGRVFVVPDGAVGLVALAALPVGDSDYLVDASHDIHYLSAERDLLLLAGQGRSGRGLLVLGGADFDADVLPRTTAGGGSTGRTGAAPSPAATRRRRPRCRRFQDLRFESVPATAVEAGTVRTLWAASGHADADRVTHLAGAAATEARLKAAAPGKRVLHLATHGFFFAGECISSTLGETHRQAERVRGLGGESAAPMGDNPLVLAGLALSGANHRVEAAAGDHDGILTADEIGGLDLRGVEWVVLSACDTGLGKVTAGEGVLGFRRAFRVAGVRTVLMSFWLVPDVAIVEWTRELYEARFEGGLDTAAAVHRASSRVLRRLRRDVAGGGPHASTHPVLWAGLVAEGDWR